MHRTGVQCKFVTGIMQVLSKISILTFTMFYLLMSTGVGYSAHYCGEELFKLGFIASDVSCCCGDVEMDDCCHNESYFIQLEDEQQHTGNDQRLKRTDYNQQLPTWLGTSTNKSMNQDGQESVERCPPPPDITPPLYLTFQSFIFYG